MDSVVQPAGGLPPALFSGIKEALACGLFGVVLPAGVYGITILQAYIYFRNNSRDSIHIRSFVALLFFLDTVSMALTVAIYYEYFVTAFGNQLLLFHTPTTFAFENGVTVLIGTLTQCFFAHRIWALSKGNIIVVSSIVILALCSFGHGIAISVNLHTHSEIYYLSSLATRILAGFGNGLSVVCDIVIAIALSYYLHSKRTGFKRTDSIIDRLIIYAINRGALTAWALEKLHTSTSMVVIANLVLGTRMCQAGHMLAIVCFPGHFVFFVFGLLDGKLYCNTLLATLNTQKSISREGDNVMELGTQVFKRHAARNRRSAVGQFDHASDCTPSFVLDVSHEKTVDVMRTLSSDDTGA